jgi:DNA-directed RNA polymerase beta subunit
MEKFVLLAAKILLAILLAKNVSPVSQSKAIFRLVTVDIVEKTYSMPLKVKMQLSSWDIDPQTNAKVIRDIKEQDVFFCDLPVMVDLYEDQDGCFQLGSQGTFLINGVDRVVVSQIHRAPGVMFSLSKKTKDYRGQPYHVARIIPGARVLA